MIVTWLFGPVSWSVESKGKLEAKFFVQKENMVCGHKLCWEFIILWFSRRKGNGDVWSHC